MIWMFHKYEYVILDASCLLAPEIDSSLLDSLRGSQIDISATFYAEAKAYLELLNEQRRKACKAYIAQFQNIRMREDTHSTWEMICSHSSAGRPIAVVTGNSLLIDRIILEETPPIKADIYDLLNKEWIPYGDFQDRRNSVELQSDKRSQVPPQAESVGYGTTLYTSSGEEVIVCRLGEKRIVGTESDLFGVENLDGKFLGIAKIFKTGSLTPGKCEHLQRLKEFADTFDCSWCLLPRETLYRDKSRQIFAGILEDYAKNYRTFFDYPPYHGDLSIFQDSPMKLSDNLRICYHLVRQVCFLNNFGFFISDYNLKNFAIRDDDSDHILMFDTDSFGFRNYFAGFRAAGSSTANKYDTTTKNGAIAFCEDSLYVAVFSLLSLGSPPIYVRKQERIFRFDEDIEDRDRKQLFPEKLWTLFEDAFRFRKDFSSDKLLLTLSECLNDLKDHPADDYDYKQDPIPPEPNQVKKASCVGHLLESGALDRIFLLLAGLCIAIVLYLLYQNGFFS